MNSKQILIFNWKISPSVDLLQFFFRYHHHLNRHWNFFLACDHQLWTQKLFPPQILIAQNFQRLPFHTYYSYFQAALLANRLGGILLNHPQNHFGVLAQKALLLLCQIHCARVFYCLGKTVNFAFPLATNLALLRQELWQIKTVFQTTTLVPILIFEPLNSTIPPAQALQATKACLAMIKNSWADWTTNRPLVCFGGNLTVATVPKFAAVDGFIVARASYTTTMICQWGEKINNA